MSVALQTFGLPPQTYTVHRNAPADGQKANRFTMLANEDRKCCPPTGAAPSTGDIAGVALESRKGGEILAVRELGEALVQVTGPVAPGQDAVIADAEGRGRTFAAGDLKRAGIWRSVAVAGELAVVDLAQKNTQPLA